MARCMLSSNGGRNAHQMVCQIHDGRYCPPGSMWTVCVSSCECVSPCVREGKVKMGSKKYLN